MKLNVLKRAANVFFFFKQSCAALVGYPDVLLAGNIYIYNIY